MVRFALLTLIALFLTSTAHGMESSGNLEEGGPPQGSGSNFYQALLEAFYTAGGGAWGPGENPNGAKTPDNVESTDPNEIIIEPGDPMPGDLTPGGAIDNGNCIDWYWEFPETRGCG